MTQVLEPQESATVVAGFDESVFRSLSGDSPLLQSKREEALNHYLSLETPTVRTEEYRRTNPVSFGFGKYKRLGSLTPAPSAASGPWDDDFDVVVDVRDDHFSIMDRSGAMAKEAFYVLSLQDAGHRFPELLQEHLHGSAMSGTGGSRKFFELADAFYNFGLFIYIPRGITVEKGVLVRYHFAADAGAFLPRVLMVAEDQSSCTVLEHYTSSDEAAMINVGAREFYVGSNAYLRVITMQEWGNRTNHIGEDWARVERDGRIDLNTISLGGKVCKLSVGCDVADQNANALLGGLYFAHGRQHFDQKTWQMHSAPNTYSNMKYKGAVKDRGHSVYQGFIRATKGSIGVDAYQTNNNLILDPTAKADSIPGLIIDADDLACSHGATMGNLDEEEIYYLRTRGIGEIEARKMLVVGFFEEVVERVPYVGVQERLHDIIETKLGY